VRGESKTSTGQSPPKGKAYSEGERQISSPRPKMGLNSCCHTARFTLTHATKPRQTAMPHTPIAPSIPASNSLRIPELRKLKSFENAYNGAFSIVAYATNRYLIDHMLRVGRMLTDNDFEAMVIWGVLAHQGVAHLMPPGILPSAALDERGRFGENDILIKPMRLRDIAQITGIPRETTRRKLGQLADKKYICKVAQGWVISSERTEPELRDFTRESVMRLLAVADEIMVALRDADRPALG